MPLLLLYVPIRRTREQEERLRPLLLHARSLLTNGDVLIAHIALSPFAFFAFIYHVYIMFVLVAGATTSASEGSYTPQAGCQHADCVTGPFRDGPA